MNSVKSYGNKHTDESDAGWTYEKILKKELILSLGCTEPIAIAYAAALARHQLGNFPQKIEIVVSSNIIKNTKSAIVPNTGGLCGIDVAAVAGVLSQRPDSKLEVLEHLSAEHIQNLESYIAKINITISRAEGKGKLYIDISEYFDNDNRLFYSDFPL